MFDLSEKRFEQDIESFLISQAGGYEQFSYTNPDGHRIMAFCEKIACNKRIVERVPIVSYFFLPLTSQNTASK